MCGIFGYIGNIPKESQCISYTLLKALFVASKSRGKDASGFSAVHLGSPKLITDKRPIDSLDFVKRSTKFRALRRSMPSIFIGHTRATTSGKPEIGRNNHPFNNSKYSIVHNGVIKDHEKLAARENLKMRTQTDSEVLLRLIERNDTLIGGLTDIKSHTSADSAMALAILQHGDSKNFSLTLYRNYGRPLYIMPIKAYHAVFFASTKEILELALKFTFEPHSLGSIASSIGYTISEIPTYIATQWGLNEVGNPYSIGNHLISYVSDYGKPVQKKSDATLPALPGFVINSSEHIKAWKECRTSTKPSDKVLFDTETSNLVHTEIVHLHGPSAAGIVQRPSADRKEHLNRIVETAKNAAEIIKLIRDEPFMTSVEIEDWKRWRTKA